MVKFRISENGFDIAKVKNGKEERYFFSQFDAYVQFKNHSEEQRQAYVNNEKVIKPKLSYISVIGNLKQFIQLHLMDINALYERESINAIKLHTVIDGIEKDFYLLSWLDLEEMKEELEKENAEYSMEKIEIEGSLKNYIDSNGLEKVT